MSKRSWVDSTHCKTLVHCESCLTNTMGPTTYEKYDFPKECPYGFTIDHLPDKNKDLPRQVLEIALENGNNTIEKLESYLIERIKFGLDLGIAEKAMRMFENGDNPIEFE